MTPQETKTKENMKIEQNKFVAVSYSLIVGEDDGHPTVMEQVPGDKPFCFIQGFDMTLPAFEKNVEGKEQGEKFDFVLSVEEGFGEYDEKNIMKLPLDVFRDDKGNIDAARVAVDHTLPMMDAEGNVINGTVVAIDDKSVTMDFNNPLAGERLHFVGEVLEVREATAEEMARATQPHNCGGCGGCHGDGKQEGGCHGKEHGGEHCHGGGHHCHRHNG